MHYLWAALALLLFSCQGPHLTVQTDYLTYKNLASYYVGTPDPRMNCPPVGQRLIISWAVPKKFLCYEDLALQVTIRFRDRQEQFEIFNILRTRGTYVYTLMNDEFFEHGGILTYKIDLVGGGCVLDKWRHQVWAELIEISHESTPTSVEALQSSDLPSSDIDWQDD